MDLRKAVLIECFGGAGPSRPAPHYFSRPGLRWRVTCACLVALGTACRAASGQESLLERWTIGYASLGWTARWEVPSGPGEPGRTDASFVPTAAGPTVRVALRAEQVSFREAFQQGSGVGIVGARIPLPGSLALRVSASSTGAEISTDGRSTYDMPRSEAFGAGLELAIDAGWAGVVEVDAMAGSDAGAAGTAGVRSLSSRHDVGVSVWRANSRAAEVVFPADSLRDLAIAHRTDGLEVSTALRLGGADGSIEPRARWVRELFVPSDNSTEGFLSASPDGSHTLLEMGVTMGDEDRAFDARYRERRAEADSPIRRGEMNAGQLPVAELEIVGWSAGLRQRRGSRSWRVGGGADRLTGFVAARVETWPFASFWEVLSAQAYRLNGELDGQSLWAELGSERVGGIDWSVQVGRYGMRVDRSSWYVTSFGLGRTDQQSTTAGVAALYMVGAELARTLRVRGGELGARVWGGVPVYGRELEDSTSAPSGGGLAGYIGFAVEWIL